MGGTQQLPSEAQILFFLAQAIVQLPADKVVEIKKAVPKVRAEGQRPVPKHRRIDASNYVLVTRCVSHLFRRNPTIIQDAGYRPDTC